jgi:predicted metal-dependent hydrolase
MKEIKHKEKTIQYKLIRRKGSKKITLSVKSDGLVVVSRPWWAVESLAFNFLREQLEWVYKKTKHLENVDPNLTTRDREHFLKYKEEGRDLTEKKLQQFNFHYNFEYKKVSIRSQTSRWGSCSSKGNLNFNYKIVFLPSELQDYLIVHELAHLKEMNHGPRFWKVMSETIENPKQLAKKLKTFDF